MKTPRKHHIDWFIKRVGKGSVTETQLGGMGCQTVYITDYEQARALHRLQNIRGSRYNDKNK